MTDIADNLVAALTDGYDDEARPVDRDRVNRALAKRRYLLGELDEMETRYADERDRLDGWRQNELSRIRSEVESIDNLSGHLLEAIRRDEADRGIPEEKRTKTLSLPNGKVLCRPQQPEYTYDLPRFVAWAQQCEGQLNLLRPKFEPDKTEVKGQLTILEPADGANPGDVLPLLTAEGEVAEGVTVTIRGHKYTVTD